MENEVQEPAPKYNYVTPEQYLEMERAAEFKHEYYDGQVFAMSGARTPHNRVAMNLYSKLGNYLQGKDCEAFPSEMRVSTPNQDAYMYPDATIVCGEPLLEDDKFDTLLNPVVVFEILSPSTRSIDKGRKFLFYQRIPSLQEYIMIDSTKRFVQIARKQTDNSWNSEFIDNTGVYFTIRTIQYDLQLDDIYYRTGL